MSQSGSKITWTVGIDWDNDSYICLNAKPGDAPNIIGLNASNIAALAQTVGPGSTVTFEDNVIDSTAWAYGKRRAVWRTGTANAAYYHLGWLNNGAYTFALPAGSLIAGLWVKSTSTAYDNVTVNLVVRNAAGAQFAGSPFVIRVSDGWKRLVLPFTVATATTGSIGLQKVGAVNARYEVAGPMLVHNLPLPSGFNNGHASRYDNVTRHVRNMRWSLNYNQPFQVLPPVGRASFSLNNPDALYSPDNGAASPIGANLRPKRQVRVYAENPATPRRVMYAGWLDAIRPTVRKSLDEITLGASDIRVYLEDREVFQLPGGTFGTQASTIADDLIDDLDLPNQMPPNSLDRPIVGLTDEQLFTYPRAALVGEDALGVLAQTAGAELAHIFFTRSGDFQWVKIQAFASNAHGGANPPDFTIDNSIMQDGDYSFGAYVTNEVTVLARRRKLSTATDKILWETEEPIILQANEILDLRANYRNPDTDNDKRIAAVNPFLELTAPAGVQHTVDFFDSNAAIKLTNTTAAPLTVTVLRVRGQKLTLFNETEMTKRNDFSVTAFGKIKKRIDYNLIESKKHARGLANYWVTRFALPSGVMHSVSFTTQPLRPEIENAMLTYSIMSEIQINDLGTAHSRRYKLIGEEFNVDNGLRSVDVRWYLEPTYDGPYPYELTGVET